MKVLHISSAKTIRGGEHQVSLLIDHLAQLNVKSVLLCPSGSELSNKKFTQLEKLITYVKLSPANLLVSAFIKRVVADEEIDIIHAHDPHSHQFVYYSYKLFGLSAPSVVTRRVSFPVKKTSRAYYAHPLIKKVVCVSNSVVRSLNNLQLSSNTRVVIPSGIPMDEDQPTLSLREKYKIDASTKIIANLAALSPQKDYITFVKTVNEFVNRSSADVKFIVIGADGGTQSEVEQLVGKLNLDKHIIFTGYLSNARRVFREVDILLSTSISEGLGNTVMEAMKYGVPIVATRCEGTVDLLVHNESALLADIGDDKVLADHLITLLSDKQLSSRLVNQAHKEIQQYDIKNTTKQVLNLYQGVLSDK